MDKKTLLAVDDAEINRKILSKLFSSDFDVIEAADGKEALDLVTEKQGNIDVIILDIIMPKYDGFYFLEKIKNTDFSDIPVVIATTDNSPEAEEKLLDLGATDLIYKPFNPQNAVKRVKAILARRENENQRIKSATSSTSSNLIAPRHKQVNKIAIPYTLAGIGRGTRKCNNSATKASVDIIPICIMYFI